MARKKLIEEMVKAIVTGYHPEKVILFGSAVKDVNKANDVDILVIKNDTRRPIDRVGEVLGLFRHTLPTDVMVYTPQEVERLEEWGDPFILRILRQGRVVYGT